MATATFYAIAGTALGGGLDIWKAAIAQAAVNMECAGSSNTVAPGLVPAWSARRQRRRGLTHVQHPGERLLGRRVPQNYGGLVTASDWMLRTGVLAGGAGTVATRPGGAQPPGDHHRFCGGPG